MDGGRRNAQNEDNQQTDLLRQALENDDINGDNSDDDEEDDGDDHGFSHTGFQTHVAILKHHQFHQPTCCWKWGACN